LKAFDFLFEIDNILINDLQCLRGVLAIFNSDLNEQTPLLRFDSQLFSLLQCVFLLAAHLNRCGDIKNGIFTLLTRASLLNQV
jgi:hypothetical protein